MKQRDTRTELYELFNIIYGEVDHGECFYDEEMFNEFITYLNEAIRLSGKYFDENQEEDL